MANGGKWRALPPIFVAILLIAAILYTSGGDMWAFRMPFERRNVDAQPVFMPPVDTPNDVLDPQVPKVETMVITRWPTDQFEGVPEFVGGLMAIELDNGYACVALDSGATKTTLDGYTTQLSGAGATTVLDRESAYIAILGEVEIHVVRDIPPFIELCGEPAMDTVSVAFADRYPAIANYPLPSGGRLVKIESEPESVAMELTYRCVAPDALKVYTNLLSGGGWGTSETTNNEDGSFYALYQNNLRTIVVDYYAHTNEFTILFDAVTFD